LYLLLKQTVMDILALRHQMISYS